MIIDPTCQSDYVLCFVAREHAKNILKERGCHYVVETSVHRKRLIIECSNNGRTYGSEIRYKNLNGKPLGSAIEQFVDEAISVLELDR
jgi:hypothetical protein